MFFVEFLTIGFRVVVVAERFPTRGDDAAGLRFELRNLSLDHSALIRILKIQNVLDALMKELAADACLIHELPGSGPIYAPRILEAFSVGESRRTLGAGEWEALQHDHPLFGGKMDPDPLPNLANEGALR